MNILAIESSCDETAAAVVADGVKIVSSAVASSTAMHKKYGGIVPEIAAREQIKCILPVINEALSIYSSRKESSTNREVTKEKFSPKGSNNIHNVIQKNIDAIAVTVGPGLIGSLLIGVETAKTIAYITGKPIIPVNHVLAHMYANFIETDPYSSREESSTNREVSKEKFSPKGSNNKISFPAISLVVSGGHTELYLMKSPTELTWLGGTIDDAAGEAFDKTARLLGFENGGGVAIQEAASLYSSSPSEKLGVKEESSTNREVTEKKFSPKGSNNIHLPRPLLHDKTLNFSFSGLKTAVMKEWQQYANSQQPKTVHSPLSTLNSEMISAFAYEVQEAITDVLVVKTMHAVEQYNAQSILLSGGVAANTRLREKFQLTINSQLSTLNLLVPPPSLCTDNAVYIASYAYFHNTPKDWHDITAVPDLSVEV